MSQNIFNSVKMTKPGKNIFDLTHDVKASFNIGELIPSYVQFCMPGDKFNISCESLLRFAPLVSPVMTRFDFSMHYFFVPMRILWPNFEKWITNGGDDPSNTSIPEFPWMEFRNDAADYKRLMDYMGLPRPDGLTSVGHKVSAMPFAAYQKIWEDYYRDQDLMTKTVQPLLDGDNDANRGWIWELQKRCWAQDYFTSARPNAQKGAAVEIPIDLSDNAPVYFQQPGVPVPQVYDINATSGSVPSPIDIQIASGNANPTQLGEVYADMANLSSTTTIEDLRAASRLQEWLEKNARGGTRYIENTYIHFGVHSSDARLQRAEYITGMKTPVVISETLSTVENTAAALPQGNMAGHGVAVMGGKSGSFFCEEHGYIIGIASILPLASYQQGIPKHFLLIDDPTQFPWPTFAHLGEQEIQHKELMAWGSNAEQVFGYTPRLAEHKFQPNRVCGDFRDTLSFWTAGRIFDPLFPPALNADFVQCDPSEVERIFAVLDPSVQKMYSQILHKVTAVRPLPKYGVPTF